jgi:Fe-S cluster assembly protein SufB
MDRPMPTWGAELNGIIFNDITYYLKATEKQATSWEELPNEIKETYDRIGVPEAEKKYLAGVSAQYESEVVYESMDKELKRLGVIFCDMDTALAKYPELVKEYFGTLIPFNDNKFAALNSAAWSGGSFVYVPKGVKVTLPLQAYFRINAESFGQFERTLIIADEDSSVHYVEGCTAPTYRTSSLHSAVVEIFVKKNAHVRYTTVQNWSKNIYNLVTKRAKAEEGALMEWIDCNIGSGVTMKYPSVYLTGKGARGEVLSIAYAGAEQHQDAGAKMIHIAPDTTSRVISKSIAKNGGRSSYRGLVHIGKGAKNAKAHVVCDALLLDDISRSDTYPTMNVERSDAQMEHEATVEKIGAEKLYYLNSRGLTETQANGLLVNGFIAPVTESIPLEYSLELYRLMNLEMENSIG